MGHYAELTARYGFIPMNHEIPKFFPVMTGAIYDQEGHEIPGHQRIYRGDTGDTLAVPTDKYTMVPYERHFTIFEKAIRESRLNQTDMLVSTDMSDNGARLFRQYLFPHEAMLITDSNGLANEIALRIVTFDSYNGSSAFIAKAGYFNFICANESIFGKSLIDVRFKHTGDVEGRVEDAADKMVVASEKFSMEAQRMQKWPKIFLTNDNVGRIVNKLPQGNERLTNELVATYARSNSETLWDLNQLLTSWSTHGLTAKTKADRQKRVSDLVEGRDWKVLEDA